MNPGIIAIISALGGVLIGAIANIIISFITKKLEYNKEIKKLIMEISLAEWKERANVAIELPEGARIYPVILDVIANSSLIRLVGERKKIRIDKVKEIIDNNLKLRKLIEDYTKKARDDGSQGQRDGNI